MIMDGAFLRLKKWINALRLSWLLQMIAKLIHMLQLFDSLGVAMGSGTVEEVVHCLPVIATEGTV